MTMMISTQKDTDIKEFNLQDKVNWKEAFELANIDGIEKMAKLILLKAEEAKEEVQEVKITISKHSSKPSQVSKAPPGKVYQYIQIETENLKKELKKAILKIKVEKIWVSDNSFERDNIVLFRFNESIEEWNELPTVYK